MSQLLRHNYSLHDHKNGALISFLWIQKEYVALPEEFSCQVDFQGMVHNTTDTCKIIDSFERRNIQFAITSTSLYSIQVYQKIVSRICNEKYNDYSKIVFTTHNEVLIKFQGDSDEKKDYCIKYTTTRIRVCGENRCSAWSRRYYVITGKLCGTHFVKLISL